MRSRIYISARGHEWLIRKCDKAAWEIHEKIGVGENLAKRGIIFLGK